MKTLSSIRSSGHSLVEMVIALAITTVVAAGTTGGWIYWVRGEKLNSVQSELDMNVRTTMELLTHDLKLSSLDKIYFYPPGTGSYTAISFPMASDTNNDGLVEMTNGGSNILWTSTVIYHIWGGSPNELRKTVFSPRNNALTDAQFQSQLASVVTNGRADGAQTRTIFANLFNWKIDGKSATFDAYAPTLQRERVSFGSILLNSGAHTIKFTAIGKNSASTGYKIGVDTITASACGVEREGEKQTVSDPSGIAAPEERSEGSWSGNYHLSFPATAPNAYFTMTLNNDRWEETNFRGQGALCERTVVGFDPTLSPKDYVVQLEGSPGYPWAPNTTRSPIWLAYFDNPAWTSERQTGTSTPISDNSNALTNFAVRILIRGNSLSQNAGALKYSGTIPFLRFAASSNGSLRISAAYIAEASDNTNYTSRAAYEGWPLCFSSDGNFSSIQWDITLASGTECYAIPYKTSASWPYLPLDAKKSYLVTFLLGSSDANAMAWNEVHAGAPGSYILRPDSEDETVKKNQARAADWSIYGSRVTETNMLFGLRDIATTYPTNGVFTSQIFDTQLTAPVFSTISWNAYFTGSSLPITIKVRTSDMADMSNSSWSNAAVYASSASTYSSTLTCPSRRYIQFQATLNPDSCGWYTPKLKDVTIRWAGDTKVVDVAAVMTKGPNYGICEVKVDDKPLVKGLRIDLKIYEAIKSWGITNTSSMTTEIEPRNTGK